MQSQDSLVEAQANIRAGINLQFVPLSYNFVPYWFFSSLPSAFRWWCYCYRLPACQMTLSLGLAVIFNIQQTLTVIIWQLGFSKYHVEPSYMNDSDYHDFFVNAVPSSSTTVETDSYFYTLLSLDTWQQLKNKYLAKLRTRLSRPCRSKEHSNMTDINYH